MDLYRFSQIWNLCSGRKNRVQYIPNDVLELCRISSTQKNSAKKAIIWLLSKTSHSVEGVADHFEMSPQLVAHLLEELIDTKHVSKIPTRPPRYTLSGTDFKNEVTIWKR